MGSRLKKLAKGIDAFKAQPIIFCDCHRQGPRQPCQDHFRMWFHENFKKLRVNKCFLSKCSGCKDCDNPWSKRMLMFMSKVKPLTGEELLDAAMRMAGPINP